MSDAAGPPIHPDDELTRLRGIGPKTAQSFATMGLTTVRDLLFHLPRRYEDRSGLVSIDSIQSATTGVLVRGTVANVRVRRVRRRLTIVDGLLADDSGEIPVVWFNQPWIANRFESQAEFYFFGQVRTRKGGALQLFNPEVEEVAEEGEAIVPVYPKIARFSGRRLRLLIQDCLPALIPFTYKTRMNSGLPLRKSL